MFVRIGKVHGPHWLGVVGSNRRCRHDWNVGILTRSHAKSKRRGDFRRVVVEENNVFYIGNGFFFKNAQRY